MKKLILIDGNAMVHRAFHAYPPLTSTQGEMVNAVYGFFAMFLKILQDFTPEYVVVCFDRPEPTFRKLLFVGYQATRPQMSDGLGPQFGIITDILEKMQVPVFSVAGYEADDIIGTLAAQAARINTNTTNIKSQISNKKGKDIDSFEIGNLKLEIIIVTGDRDMMQLVNKHVKILMPITGITNTVLYDEDKVKEKFGLNPHQFIDYKALIGDASDNYPGVGGIGPKTASSLLTTYETFENLYEHLSELPERIATKLATDAEQAALAKKLATIATDVPVKLEIEKCHCLAFDIAATKKAFDDLGFHSLQKRLPGYTEEETLRQAQGKQKKIPVQNKSDDSQLELL